MYQEETSSSTMIRLDPRRSPSTCTLPPVDNWKSFHFFASANSHLGMRPTLVYADTFYESCTANRVVIHQETVQWTSSCSNRDTLLEVCLQFFGDCWVVIKRTIRKDETGNKSTIKSIREFANVVIRILIHFAIICRE